jgi:hypothetical protein
VAGACARVCGVWCVGAPAAAAGVVLSSGRAFAGALKVAMRWPVPLLLLQHPAFGGKDKTKTKCLYNTDRIHCGCSRQQTAGVRAHQIQRGSGGSAYPKSSQSPCGLSKSRARGNTPLVAKA